MTVPQLILISSKKSLFSKVIKGKNWGIIWPYLPSQGANWGGHGPTKQSLMKTLIIQRMLNLVLLLTCVLPFCLISLVPGMPFESYMERKKRPLETRTVRKEGFKLPKQVTILAPVFSRQVKTPKLVNGKHSSAKMGQVWFFRVYGKLTLEWKNWTSFISTEEHFLLAT